MDRAAGLDKGRATDERSETETRECSRLQKLVVATAVTAVAALVAVSLSRDPSGVDPDSAKVPRPQLEHPVKTKRTFNKAGFTVDDAVDLAASTAHQSLSDRTYPERPDKKVSVLTECVIVPSPKKGMSFLVQNPIATNQMSADGKHAMAGWFGIVPLEHRYTDGTLRFQVVAAVAIDGHMQIGELGTLPNSVFSSHRVRLERTDIERSQKEIPNDLFSNDAVYLRDFEGKVSLNPERIPGHTTYMTDAQAHERCDVPATQADVTSL